MRKLALVAVTGLAAQLVDGALSSLSPQLLGLRLNNCGLDGAGGSLAPPLSPS